jgi:GntR family transcriptional regulator
MFLKVDHSSGVPIYRQIVEQIRFSIAKGVLARGDRLPAIRQLSLDLEVNPNTVIKAYNQLENGKVIHTKRGMGTFVSDEVIEISMEEKMKRITKLAERLAVEAVQLDIDESELKRIVAETLARFRVGERKGEKS